MTDACAIVARVDAVRRAALMLVEHGDAEMAQVGGALVAFLVTAKRPLDADQRHAPLESLLGLGPTWRGDVRRQRRDALFLDIRKRRYGDLSNRRAAEQLSIDAARYAASAWLRDQRAGRRPDGLPGDLFDLLSLGAVPAEASLRHLFDRQTAPKFALGKGQAAAQSSR
jgi:hypothetical protein